MTFARELKVPLTAMVDVASMIEENELSVCIQGPHGEERDTIVIEIQYEAGEREAVHALEDFIEDAWAEIHENEDDDDEDDEDDEKDDDDEEDDDDEDDDDDEEDDDDEDDD